MLVQNIPIPAQTNLLVFKDYIPLLQTLVWPVFWLIVFLVFKKQVTHLFQLVTRQIEKGGSVEVAGFKLVGGKLVEKTSDLGDKVDIAGNPDRFELLFKAQGISQGSFFKKSTKAMKVPGGCVIQVTNERQNPDGSWSVAESLTFVPGEVTIKEDKASGRFLDKFDQVLKSE
ncbi:hypothetical protein [Anabaena sp. UHCC 0399]|uniref:hypothetical protein n=1 Tax=Anabaena sp. UHCC 0399 TaxID=3110238 RepID=UPI002B1F1FC9|nr:hypothetical protein [Anabaena sp. UHCC 0399]MEA5566292.1 hypothetical protein [Anabaena sp. UHCC 0399]